MLRRITVLEPGDTDLLPGELVDHLRFQSANAKRYKRVERLHLVVPELMGTYQGITCNRVWLSAASFQEQPAFLPMRVVRESDPLLGLKENVIIGKLIPAGTGLARLSQRAS